MPKTVDVIAILRGARSFFEGVLGPGAEIELDFDRQEGVLTIASPLLKGGETPVDSPDAPAQAGPPPSARSMSSERVAPRVRLQRELEILRTISFDDLRAAARAMGVTEGEYVRWAAENDPRTLATLERHELERCFSDEELDLHRRRVGFRGTLDQFKANLARDAAVHGA